MGVLVDGERCALAAHTANWILGCIRSSVTSSLREAIPPLYSALLRAHPERCVQHWGPQHKEDMELLEQVWRRPRR